MPRSAQLEVCAAGMHCCAKEGVLGLWRAQNGKIQFGSAAIGRDVYARDGVAGKTVAFYARDGSTKELWEVQ